MRSPELEIKEVPKNSSAERVQRVKDCRYNKARSLNSSSLSRSVPLVTGCVLYTSITSLGIETIVLISLLSALPCVPATTATICTLFTDKLPAVITASCVVRYCAPASFLTTEPAGMVKLFKLDALTMVSTAPLALVESIRLMPTAGSSFTLSSKSCPLAFLM